MADFYKNFDLIHNTTDHPTLEGLQYSVVTDIPSANEPVDLAFFKEHARIDFDTDDTLAEVYIIAARRVLEKHTQRSFGPKTLKVTAIHLPKNWRLAYGPVKDINTADFTAVGDILKEGGDDIEVEYTTDGIQDETVKIAICRYATGLYVFRENILDTKLDARAEMDQAKAMLASYKFITLF